MSVHVTMEPVSQDVNEFLHTITGVRQMDSETQAALNDEVSGQFILVLAGCYYCYDPITRTWKRCCIAHKP